MRKRSSRDSRLDEDEIQAARRVIDIATGERPKSDGEAPVKRMIDLKVSRAAAALGRLGGLKGGKARNDALTPERRAEIARDAARKRWARKP